MSSSDTPTLGLIRTVRYVVAAGAAALSACGLGRTTWRYHARDFWTDPRMITLVDAAARGDVAGVRAAREAGADPNAGGKDGMIPLLFVMTAKSHAGMRALLAVGADPNAPGPPEMPLLPSAAGADDPELLRILLDGGADPSAVGPGGEPLLFATIFQHRWTNLRLLVERGADVNGAKRNRQIPAILCAGLSYWDQVAYLVEHGADPLRPELSGSTLAYEVEWALERAGGHDDAKIRRVRDMLVARGVTFPTERPASVRKRVFGFEPLSGPATARAPR